MSSLRLWDMMQSRIICSLEIHNWCKWLDCNMGKYPRIVSFCVLFHMDARLNNLIPDKVIGVKKLKWKGACGSGFVQIIWKPLSLKMSTTLRVWSSGSAFCKNYQRTKECRSREELVEVIVALSTLSIAFNLLYIIS